MRGAAVARAALESRGPEEPRAVGVRAGRQLRGQPACSRTLAAARRGGNREVSKRSGGAAAGRRSRDMKLHCEVEVVSRQLPALGMRNRGKGVRAVLSLCQQTARGQPRARGERSGPHLTCLFISTLKDKRGTRYEVRGPNWPRGSRPSAPPLRASPARPLPRLEPACGVPEPHHRPEPWASVRPSPCGPERGKLLRAHLLVYFSLPFLWL